MTSRSMQHVSLPDGAAAAGLIKEGDILILIFKQTVHGRNSHCEILCNELDAELHRKVQTAAGWILVSVIAPTGEQWTNESMKLCCVHGSCCEDTQCKGCDDFEFKSTRMFI